ncbi:MAG: hypothetical protein N2235_24475 [Fischerella sp.]|nr:hypothetical protein [Fischerella sp.]
MISSYLGKSEAFDSAVADFAVNCADRVEQDDQAIITVVKSGRIEAKS